MGGGSVQFSQYNKDGIHSTNGTIPLRQKAGKSTIIERKEKKGSCVCGQIYRFGHWNLRELSIDSFYFLYEVGGDVTC